MYNLQNKLYWSNKSVVVVISSILLACYLALINRYLPVYLLQAMLASISI